LPTLECSLFSIANGTHGELGDEFGWSIKQLEDKKTQQIKIKKIEGITAQYKSPRKVQVLPAH